MDTLNQGRIIHDFNALNFVGDDPLPRDQTQSARLHEPDHLRNTIDPITGHDLEDIPGHPSLVDGNVTMYFESEATRQEYLDMPIDHPFHLVDNPTDEGYDEGWTTIPLDPGNFYRAAEYAMISGISFK